MRKLPNLKKISSFIIAGAVIAGSFIVSAPGSKAAGVIITATPSTASLSTATDITFTYTAGQTVDPTGTTYTFTVSPTLPGALANCTSADVQADTTAGGDGSFGSLSTTGAVFTTSSDTTTTGRSLCLKFPSISSPQTYSVALTASGTGVSDYGATLVYIAGDNQVTVSASISPTLSFNIRSFDDSSDTNVCNLGTITSTTAPNSNTTVDGAGECGYSLAIGTNAGSGFQVQITSDGKLRNGSVEIADITNDTSFSAGAEAYGIANIIAAQTGRNSSTGVYDQTITEDSTASYTFQTNTSPIPQTPQNFISYTNGIQYTAGSGSTDVTQIIHGLAVGSGTPAGTYTQIVTYTLTATF